MKMRILSAVVGILILFTILFCPLTWVLAVAAAALATIAVWELLHNTGIVPQKGFLYSGMLFAGTEVLAIAYAEYLGWLPFALPALYLLVAVFIAAMPRYGVPIHKALKAVVLTTYAMLGFAALVRLRFRTDGLFYVLLPMVISWMSDTGAYFTGMLFGKHKMAPIISPKKTWEGFFGGWLVSVGCSALYVLLYQWLAGVQLAVAPLWTAVLAVPLAPLSVCGDLLASRIKRSCGIKDYGNIMPGHGGVMDRFDSVVMVAPVLWILLAVFA